MPRRASNPRRTIDLDMSSTRIIASVCTAQVFGQIGAYAVPALLPILIESWMLSYTEAGWLTGIFYGAYVLAVPILVSLTDRIDPRRIYIASVITTMVSHIGLALLADGFWTAMLFRVLAGIGWAGTYMPGLKALTDHLEGTTRTRGVSWHAASVGISGSLSFVIAGLVGQELGWRWAFGVGALCSFIALVIGMFAIPKQREISKPAATESRLLDFRPVFRNRSAMAYAVTYCVHTWELSVQRNWVVAFLTFAALHTGSGSDILAPTVVATVMGLLGTWSSVMGNEASIRFGRQRWVLGVTLASMAVTLGVGWSSGVSYYVATVLVLIHGILIYADSSSLTAGTTGSAEDGRRGATLAVHSTLGYIGGFLGPLVTGLVLDLVGGESVAGWGIAFGYLAAILLVGPAALFVWRPKDLPGDRPVNPRT